MKNPDGYTWSGETDKKANDLQARHLVARDLERCPMHRLANKSTNGPSRNRSWTMHEITVVFTSLILKMKNSRKFSKHARRKLEVPLPAAKLNVRSRGKPVALNRIARQNTRALLKTYGRIFSSQEAVEKERAKHSRKYLHGS